MKGKIALLILNSLSTIFILAASIFSLSGITAQIFTAFMLVTFCADIYFFAFSKLRFSVPALLLIIFLLLVNCLMLYASTLSAFASSVSVIALIALCLISAISFVGIVCEIRNKSGQREEKHRL